MGMEPKSDTDKANTLSAVLSHSFSEQLRQILGQFMYHFFANVPFNAS